MAARSVIVIIEPLREIRETKTQILQRDGLGVVGIGSPTAAHALLDRTSAALVLLNMPSPVVSWAPLESFLSRHPTVPVIVMQAPPRIEDAVEAVKRGAIDYLAKSLDPAPLLRGVHAALRATARGPHSDTELIERSAAMRGIMEYVRRVAPSVSNIVLFGESGVGKEVVARYIHRLSARATKEFVAVNCASLSDDILENELFGHERGAFTSANERKLGLFDLAHEGTLFLDEIGEMGLGCQARLLRAIERKEFRRVGGTAHVRVDVRIIAATNADLSEAVTNRRFRRDLYYRLNVINFRIPPLRERRAVVAEMIEHFLSEFSAKARRRVRSISPDVMARLTAYDWPGNVRELRNTIESLVVSAPGPRIELRDLPSTIGEAAPRGELTVSLGSSMDEIEREVFRAYLAKYGTKKAAAMILRVPLRTFHAKAKRYELVRKHTRRGEGAASESKPEVQAGPHARRRKD